MDRAEPVPLFETTQLPVAVGAVAPHGSDVRVLLRFPAGSLSHFTLPPGQTSVAIEHRTISEIWYFLGGHGQMWRAQEGHVETVDVGPGTAITIPVGTAFQFRSTSDEKLVAVGVTMPPWPGEGETTLVEHAPWRPTSSAGPA